MLASALFMTACGKEEEEEEITEIVFPATLTLWLPAAEGTEVDDESVVYVENAINEFTQANFKTAIKLKVFPADQYDSYVLSKIYELKDAEDKAAAKAAEERRKKREAKKNGTTTAEESESAVDTTSLDETSEEAVDTVVDTSEADTAALESATDTAADASSEDTAEQSETAYQIEKTDPAKYILPADSDGKRPYDYEYKNAFLNSSLFTSYPQVESDQFDIFLIHGYEEFQLLNGDYLLSDLTSNVANESKILRSYINPAFFLGATYENALSVIPNNRCVGNAEVMLINKKVCEELSYDPALFTKIDSIFNYDETGISFLEDVIKNKPDIIPVAGDFKIPNVKYFSETDDDTFSLITAQIDVGTTEFTPFVKTIKSPFEQTSFINNYRSYKRLHQLATPVDFDSADEFAVGFYNGSLEDLKDYEEDYQFVVLQYPQMSRDDAFETGFAVSAYTKSMERSMEIITAINTNTELRTILQYGKEGVNWRYDMEDDSIIRILNDKYKMDLKETGNSFVTYPAEGTPISAWDSAKNSNKMLYLPYSYGMVSVTEQTEPLLKDLSARSAEFYNRIQAMSLDEFNANLTALRDEVKAIESYDKLSFYFDGTDPKKEEEMDPEESLPMIFRDYATNIRGW